MPLVSLAFAGFLSLVLAVYYWAPPRWQNYWLVLASYLFCTSWAPPFALILLIVTIANFLIARRLRPRDPRTRNWLWLGIALNVITLLFFRQANWYAAELAALLNALGIPVALPPLGIILPLGLSFYGLQAISYLVDVSRGQIPAESNPVDLALYMAYLPKLIAGPIERAGTLLPQLKQTRTVDNERLARATCLIVTGLVRKLAIADSLAAMIPANAFQGRTDPGIAAVTWLVAYYFFLYNDFAGYTSIVRGISALFGIELSPNFAAPFFARSLSEYWTRWHITLSNWLRDYCFMPVSRSLLRRDPSPHNVANLFLPPVLAMLVSGMWHGGTLNMLLWGGLHGLYLAAERIPAFWRPHIPVHRLPAWRQALAMLAVFGLTLFALALFVMDVPTAFRYWQSMLDLSHRAALDWRVPLLIVPSLALDWLQYHFRDEVVFLRWSRAAQATLLAAALLTVFLVSLSDSGVPFVYQGF